MPKTVLFDLDGTLWNPRKLVTLFGEALHRSYRLSSGDHTAFLDEYLSTLVDSTHFSPDSYIDFLCAQLRDRGVPVEERELAATFYDRVSFVSALYPEVLPVLEKLQKDTSLGIFSQGFSDFQLMKLQLSGIFSFFESDKLFISSDKLDPAYRKLLPPAVVIDDRPVVIQALLATEDVVPVWLRRSDGAHAASTELLESLKEVPTISTLEGIFDILDKYSRAN